MTAWVIWPFSLTTSGDYEVYARWVDHPKRATNATYTIDNGALSQSVPVDQTANCGAWQLLGTYTLDAAQAVTVTLTNDANDTVVADAVELRKIGGSTAPALFYYHNDHLGTPQRLTDASGGLAWDADYQPFGETDAPNSSVGQALRFPGQFADGETGFNYNYFRTYDPSIGRYTQSDPIGLYGGLNRISYVSNAPVNSSDRLGLVAGPLLVKLWHAAMKTPAAERAAAEGLQSKIIDSGIGVGSAVATDGGVGAGTSVGDVLSIAQTAGGAQTVSLGYMIANNGSPVAGAWGIGALASFLGGYTIGDVLNERIVEPWLMDSYGMTHGEIYYCYIHPVECAEMICDIHPEICESPEAVPCPQ